MSPSSTSKGFTAGLKKLFRSKPSDEQTSNSAQAPQPQPKAAAPVMPTIEPIGVEKDGYIRLQADNDEFRLLKVEGKGFTSSYVDYSELQRCPIKGRLEIYSLQNCPPYLALSYEWGDPPQAQVVHTAGRPLNLQENLLKLLSALAAVYFDRPREAWSDSTRPPPAQYLWVDQICINQRSKSERGSQVKMMGEIFRKAKSVIAWPGYVLEYHRPSHSGPNMVLEVERFLQARYWHRLWVVQEVILAQEILTLFKVVSVDGRREDDPWEPISNSRIALQTWPLLIGSLREYSDSKDVFQQADRHLKGFVAHRRASTGFRQLSLMDALSQFSDSSCLDPRDKVYGLLGIVKPEQRIAVNYRSSTEEVFEAAVSMVRANAELGSREDHKQGVVLSLLARDMAVQFNGVVSNVEAGPKSITSPDDRIDSGLVTQANERSRRRNSFG
jgi:hypothetical protein